MQTRSFTNQFEVTDYTQELVSIPNTWGLVNELGIFRNEPVSQHTVTVESRNGSLALVGDKMRGERANVNKDDTRVLRTFAVPHFPVDDAVKPEDIQGKRAYGSDNMAETEANVIASKLQRIRQNHAATLEKARCYALTTGAIYAPNGTVSGNYFTEFGITQKSIDFTLGTSTTDLIGKVEEGIAHQQDSILSGESITGVVVLCSPEWFAKFIASPKIADAFRYYSSTQEPLRNRLGSGVYRRFEFGGATFLEYRGVFNDGSRLIPTGEAVMVPTGTNDTFISYFSPANKFSLVNTLGEEAYAFTYRNSTDSEITIETEHNHLALVRRPQVLVKLTTSN